MVLSADHRAVSHAPTTTVRSKGGLTSDPRRTTCRIPGMLCAVVRQRWDFLARRTARSGTSKVEISRGDLRETRIKLPEQIGAQGEVFAAISPEGFC